MSTSNGYLDALRAVYARADSTDIAAGRMWYYAARGELWDLSRKYGVSLKRVCWAAAALSNNMEWGQNVALLEHVLYSLTRGSGALQGHYRRCLDKARRIVTRGEFGALRGPKVVPFAAALYGDTSAAVVDRWVARAAGVEGRLTDKRSRDVALALRALAREQRSPVTTVQAIVWVVIRRAADPSQAPIPF